MAQLTVPRLKGAISRVLADATYRENAAKMQAEIQNAGGVAKAADIIEQINGSKPAYQHDGLLKGDLVLSLCLFLASDPLRGGEVTKKSDLCYRSVNRLRQQPAEISLQPSVDVYLIFCVDSIDVLPTMKHEVHSKKLTPDR